MFYITFFNKCINDKTIKIIVIYEMNLQDIQYFINYYLYKCPITQFSSTAGDITRVVNYKDINLNKNDVFNAVVPAYVDDEQNNEIEGSTTEYELKSPDGKEINPDQNLSGEDAKSAYYMVTVEVDSDEHGIAIGQGIRQEGNFAKVEAVAKEGYQFVGWYENDKLISQETQYRFFYKNTIKI